VSRRIALLVNPTSGKGRGKRAGAQAAARLREHGLAVDVLVGADGSEATELARGAVRLGYEAIAAVGGDGMLNLVLQAVAGSGDRLSCDGSAATASCPLPSCHAGNTAAVAS